MSSIRSSAVESLSDKGHDQRGDFKVAEYQPSDRHSPASHRITREVDLVQADVSADNSDDAWKNRAQPQQTEYQAGERPTAI